MSSAIPKFTGSIAENYDTNLGPALFTPYANDMATRLPTPAPSRVLELACGTGRLTSVLRTTLPEDSALVATDLSEGMLKVAQDRVLGKIEWLPADMQALPFESASFDCIVAQFGVMLAPDKLKAFSEARRVLSPGGTFLFSVWPSRDAGPSFFRLTVQAVQKYAPADMADSIAGMSAAGHSLSNTEEVCNMLRESGFSSCKFTMAHVRGISADLLSRGFIFGSPISSLIPDPESKLACVEELKVSMGDSVDAEAIVYEAFV